jgi:hypothetical protein
MIGMLVARYVFAIRWERLICREVQVNLAYRAIVKTPINMGFSHFQKGCGRLLGESRPRANPVWGRGGVGT